MRQAEQIFNSFVVTAAYDSVTVGMHINAASASGSIAFSFECAPQQKNNNVGVVILLID